jgi:putative tricarboxylic transport membrane protein
VALIMHGIRPGPLLLLEHPKLFWGFIASMYIGNLMLLGLNFHLIRFRVKLLNVPYRFLAVVVVIIWVIGAYSVNNLVFDIGTMVFLAVFAYFIRKGGYPAALLILAMILVPMLEKTLQQSLITSGGTPLIFVQRRISASLLIAGALLMLTPVLKWVLKKHFQPTAKSPGA